MKQVNVIGGFSILFGVCFLLGFSGTPRFVQAEETSQYVQYAKKIKTEYQYAAKVACSLLLPHQDSTLATGIYRSIINIHNPTDKKITIAAKVALATQFGSEPGPFDVTPFKSAVLQPDGAVGINCFDIAGYFCPIDGVCVDFAFLEGFLVIKSPESLDVVGVYTARHSEGEVESIDVETVKPRRIRDIVKLEPAKPAEPGEGKRIEYPPKGSSAYGDQNPSKCVAELPDFHVPTA